MNTSFQTSSRNLSKKVVSDLKLLLANTYVLYVKTQNFHWNVKGPRFQQLHLFFEGQYTALAEAIDEIAEQIRILQSRPPASLKEFLDLSNLQESIDELSEDEMLRELLNDHETLIRLLSEWFDDSQELKDESSADLFIERMRAHEKMAWMIRSHLG